MSIQAEGCPSALSAVRTSVMIYVNSATGGRTCRFSTLSGIWTTIRTATFSTLPSMDSVKKSGIYIGVVYEEADESPDLPRNRL